MVDLSNLRLSTPSISLRKSAWSSTTSSIKNDSNTLQNDLIKENSDNKNIVLDRYNSFMKDRANLRTTLRKSANSSKETNTNDASAQMSLVFDFIRDVWAEVYWNPEKAQATKDPEIATIAWLTGDNISYENIAAFNDFINNPKWWDLTWTVYQLVAWDTRMRQYMEAKYYGVNGLESWEDTYPTLYWTLDKLWRGMDEVPVIWNLLWAGRDAISSITDAAVTSLASIWDIVWKWSEKVTNLLVDSPMSEWLYNLSKQEWYTWTYEEWKDENKDIYSKNINLVDMWKWWQEQEIPESRYERGSVSSNIWNALFTIWEMIIWWWEKKLAQEAAKPWVRWKVADFLYKVKKAWATDSEAKWYLKWLARMAEGWVQWAEAQWFTDLSKWELSSLEQYEMSAWAWSFLNWIMWWGKWLYEDIKSPNKNVKTSLWRLDTKTVENIWNQAKQKSIDKTLKTPTQNLWWEVNTMIKNEVKPTLDTVWKEIEWLEAGLIDNTAIWAEDAISNINNILDKKWINIQFEPVDINGKTVYRASWWGNIIQVWDKYIEEQSNPFIKEIVEEINKISPSEFNTAKWYARVIKAVKKASNDYSKEWWDIIGKLWSEANTMNKPLEDIMWVDNYASYMDKNWIYSKIAKFKKDLSDVERELSNWNRVDPSRLKALEKQAEELWYDLSWLADKSIIAEAAEKFYKLEEWRQPTIPRPSKWGAEKWSLEQIKNSMVTKPENWKKYAWDYKPSAWQQMFAEVWENIPWEMWTQVWEFTYE